MGVAIIIAATILCSWRAFQTNRSYMLYCGMLQNALFALYWGSIGEYTAMSIALVGVTCIILQNFIGSFGMRFTIAMGAATLAYYLNHDHWMDIIPLLAFTFGRVGESFDNHHHIRFGYQLSAAAWLGFSFMTGNVAAIVSNSVIMVSQTVAMAHNAGYISRLALAFKRSA